MSDSQQPSFFGGLPPRGGLAVVDSMVKEPIEAEASQRKQPLNTLAVIAFTVSFFVSIAGVALGFLALRQLRGRDQRGRGLALAGLLVGAMGIAVTAALFAVFLYGGTSLVASITGISQPSSTASPFPQTPKISAQEAAAAKAAVASGGGAIPGHIVSGDLCRALGAFQTTSSGKSTVSDVEPGVLASMQALAAVESPNQEVYREAAALAADPASVPSIVKAQAIVADFAKAVQVDATTCP